ncbi:MAG: alpha/beta hydrolase [Alphaproteobacteria bacterium]|nr:alpha/beta hydrolase [Alphaproteobacteria bacterium]
MQDQGHRETGSVPLWAGLTADEHEFQYNPQRSVQDFKQFQARREGPNAAAKARLRCFADQTYGEHPLRKLDIYPAALSGAPVHMFFHGGYWRAQDKQNFAFVAAPLVDAGITAVIVNYELCPASTLDGVVDSAVAATDWTLRNIARHGGDPARLTLSGHSAGAHLGAAILATDWPARGLSADAIKGAVLISGIYDPAPAERTSVNAEIGLTPALIARHDYERRPLKVSCPAWIIAGGREPWHWIDQSFRYAHHLRRHGGDPGVTVSPGYHHFDIMDQYRDPGSDVLRPVLALATR